MATLFWWACHIIKTKWRIKTFLQDPITPQTNHLVHGWILSKSGNRRRKRLHSSSILDPTGFHPAQLKLKCLVKGKVLNQDRTQLWIQNNLTWINLKRWIKDIMINFIWKMTLGVKSILSLVPKTIFSPTWLSSSHLF